MRRFHSESLLKGHLCPKNFSVFLFFSPPDWVLNVGLGVRGGRQPLDNKDSSSAAVHFPPPDVRKQEFNISFPSFSSRFDRRPSHFHVGCGRR